MPVPSFYLDDKRGWLITLTHLPFAMGQCSTAILIRHPLFILTPDVERALSLFGQKG